MQTEIIITGTGCPLPAPERAGPSALIRRGDLALLFDAGRSVVQRMTSVGVFPMDLDAVFVTHHHSDHLSGLADVALTRWTMDWDAEFGRLPVVAPEGPSAEFARRVLDTWGDDLEARRAHNHRTDRAEPEVTAFAYPDAPTVVWEQGPVTVSAGQVRHEPVHPAVGYRIETPEGSVVITGDTLVCDEVAELAAGADVLVYEAMRFELVEQWPEVRHFIMKYHADTRLIGRQAAELGVSTVVLTHLIPAPATDEEKQAFGDDVRNAGFEGEIIVADDLDVVTLG